MGLSPLSGSTTLTISYDSGLSGYFYCTEAAFSQSQPVTGGHYHFYAYLTGELEKDKRPTYGER